MLYDVTSDEHLFNGIGVVTVAGGEYFGPGNNCGHPQTSADWQRPPSRSLPSKSGRVLAIPCDKYLPALNARCLVLTDIIEPLKTGMGTEIKFDITHYQLKALALLFSSFQEVLLLDSDSILLSDPFESLFQSDTYITYGFIGWPDLWIGTESPLFYTIAGLPSFPPNLPQACAEAGQLLVDKSPHLKTLLIAVYYNIFGPGYYYELLSQGALGQGDKNTFESAAIVLNAPYFRVNSSVEVIGRINAGKFMGTAMVQMHPESGVPAFIHSNTPKMNAGHLVDEGDLQDGDTKKHLRLWGSKGKCERMFGKDMEKEIWEILVETGCELEDVVWEWKDRKGLCKKLKMHFEKAFGEDDD